MHEYAPLVLVIFLSLLFTYTNGFQDGSSVAAGAISCRAMSKLQAVILCAICEFSGALLGGSAVAKSIGALTSYPDDMTILPILASALFAAILWNYITKIIKVPSSSTHALVGGILGALYAGAHSFKYIIWGDWGYLIHPTGVYKVVISLFASPVIGFAAGYAFYKIVMFALSRATTKVNKPLRGLQWITVALLAFGHGANDTQKAMGIVLLALGAFSHGGITEIPLWVRIISGLAMSCGIASLVPGIVKRVGGGIYKMRPLHGFVTEASSAIIVMIGSATGGPVSASQVIASTVMGVGTAERKKGVHWLIARDMIVAWMITIPFSGLLAFILFEVLFRFMPH